MSEKTKRLMSLWFGVLSLVLWLMPAWINHLVMRDGAGHVFFEYLDQHFILFLFASVTMGILAVITGCSSKCNIAIVLGCIGALLSAMLVFGTLMLISGSRRFSCHYPMEVFSIATQKYCEQNNGNLPDAETWCDQLLKSVEDVKYFSLETFSGRYGLSLDRDEKRSGFAFNKNLDGCRLSEVDCETVFLFETDLGWNQNGTSAILLPNGYPGFWPFFEGGYPFVFVGPDSTFTVKFVKNSELDHLNWTVDE